MQPIIHQSPASSVKIETDGKGNAKPSVHVYNENPRVAMLDAADIYEKLVEKLKPGPPPEPIAVYHGDYELFDEAWRKKRREDVPYALMSFGFTADQVAWIMGQEPEGEG